MKLCAAGPPTPRMRKGSSKVLSLQLSALTRTLKNVTKCAEVTAVQEEKQDK